MSTLLFTFAAVVLTLIMIISLWDLSPMVAVVVASLLALGLGLLTVVRVLHSFEKGEN